MDFETYLKVHNMVSVHPKSIMLRQVTNLNTVCDTCRLHTVDLQTCRLADLHTFVTLTNHVTLDNKTN